MSATPHIRPSDAVMQASGGAAYQPDPEFLNLSQVSIDWSDFDAAGLKSRRLATAIALDKPRLRRMVFDIERNPKLLAMCERHHLLDYLVLHDAIDRGFRIRIHISTENHLERPHDHRFSFSSYIIHGKYTHTIHAILNRPYTDADNVVKSHMSLDQADPRDRVMESEIVTLLTRDETAGSCYTLHHGTVHTTFTTPDTISLFVRGPAEKDRSLIYDKQTKKYWWRFGQQNEPPERRQDKTMSMADYKTLRDRLEQLGVI